MRNFEPVCMIDPEAYDMVFRRGLMAERADCECCGERCDESDMVACCDCDYTLLCENCAIDTGIEDKHRCLACEDERLDRLQEACRLIGAEVAA